MKIIGQIVAGLGSLFLLLALLMDTTVQAGYGRVHNIGLLSDRQNYLFLGFVLLGVGLVMIFRFKTSGLAQTTTPGDTRICPFCAETIKSKAVICRYCGTSVQSIVSEVQPEEGSVYRAVSRETKCTDARPIPMLAEVSPLGRWFSERLDLLLAGGVFIGLAVLGASEINTYGWKVAALFWKFIIFCQIAIIAIGIPFALFRFGGTFRVIVSKWRKEIGAD